MLKVFQKNVSWSLFYIVYKFFAQRAAFEKIFKVQFELHVKQGLCLTSSDN